MSSNLSKLSKKVIKNILQFKSAYRFREQLLDIINLYSHLINLNFSFDMTNWFIFRWYSVLLISTILSLIGLQTLPAKAEPKIYSPLSISSEQEVADILTEDDIPTGEGGFARDYFVQLQAGDQVAIDLTSENFDTMVTLIASDGATVAENDDGPDGTTNSLLFSRITETGKYIVRVRAFGETSGGKFTLKLTRLKPTSK